MGGPRGYDAGKKINGRKRHVLVDVLGLVLAVIVLAANIQDRDAGWRLLAALHRTIPSMTKLWADGAYAGEFVRRAHDELNIDVDIVKKPADMHAFKLLPHRWVVERTFGWFNRERRLSKDYERLPATTEALVRVSMIRLMTRRLSRHAGEPTGPTAPEAAERAPPRSVQPAAVVGKMQPISSETSSEPAGAPRLTPRHVDGGHPVGGRGLRRHPIYQVRYRPTDSGSASASAARPRGRPPSPPGTSSAPGPRADRRRPAHPRARPGDEARVSPRFAAWRRRSSRHGASHGLRLVGRGSRRCRRLLAPASVRGAQGGGNGRPLPSPSTSCSR